LTDFRSRLATIGISQTELRRWIENVTGHRLAPTTTSRWAKGHRALPPEMTALLAVIENPDLLAELKRR
jgi:hypothetical protein